MTERVEDCGGGFFLCDLVTWWKTRREKGVKGSWIRFDFGHVHRNSIRLSAVG